MSSPRTNAACSAEPLAVNAAALAWLDRERPNLIATVEDAASTGDHLIATRVSGALADYLQWRRYFTEWVTVAEHGKRAAHHLQNPDYRAATSTILGNGLRTVARFEAAVTAHQNAVEIYQEAGNRTGQATAWGNLGVALRHVGRFAEAIAAQKQALGFLRESGERNEEGRAWNNLGASLLSAKQLDEAIDAYRHAIALHRQTGDLRQEGMALSNLGEALLEAGRLEECITACRQAVTHFHHVGDRHGEGSALSNLGLALQAAQRSDEAQHCWLEALDAFTAIDALDEAALVRELLDEL